MRKFSFKLYLVCSICFLILSCSKSREDKQIENPRLQAVKSLQFLEERKTAYQLLNSEEKATIWKQHLQEIISTVKFDSNKEELIKEALTFLNKEKFASTSTFWKSNEFEIWKYKVVKTFSAKEKAKLFNDVRIIRNSEFTNAPQGGDVVLFNAPAPCDCNSTGDGDFCGNNNHGDICTGFYTYKCTASGCSSANSGCGWFWSYACNGTCKETYTKGACGSV